VETVVLLDDAGTAVGTHPKATVHTTETPLHLAFSSYVINHRGEVLITRRARSKPTWPGVWTNSCCGHPAPNEPLDRAVLRRLSQELGIDAASATVVLPDFRYRAVMENGIVENEICPVFRVLYDGPDPTPHPDEVDAIEWHPWPQFSHQVINGTRTVSPWCVDQVQQLQRLGVEPHRWPSAAADRLPAAARHAATAS
jgi:isopentenyl-diphosphate Delta-isomerase